MAKTAMRKAYDKEIRRINRFIKNASKRGYTFDMEAIQEMIPEAGNRITAKKIQILKSIKAPKLYSKATYREPGTGRIMSGFKGREEERRKAALKGIRSAGMDYFDQDGEYDASEVQSIIDQLLEMYSMTYAPGYGGFSLLMGELESMYGSIEGVALAIAPVPDVLDLMYSGVLFESDGSGAQKQAANSIVSRIANASGIPSEETNNIQDEMDDMNV